MQQTCINMRMIYEKSVSDEWDDRLNHEQSLHVLGPLSVEAFKVN